MRTETEKSVIVVLFIPQLQDVTHQTMRTETEKSVIVVFIYSIATGCTI